MGTNTATKKGLIVVAHGEDELHLVRDAYFATWAHVHLGKTCGSGPAGELHIECEHSLAEVVAATPQAEQTVPVMAHARLIGTLAKEAQSHLVKHAVEEHSQLRDLAPAELAGLLRSAREAAETLSALSADLAQVLLESPLPFADLPGGDQAIKATLAAIVVHEDLRNLIDVVSHRPGSSERPGRNQPCPCGSGRKYKRCCGATA